MTTSVSGPVSFVAAICPQCSGSLQLSVNIERALCSYCGATILVHSLESTGDREIQNLVFLGKEAEKAGNYQQAFDYFSQVLAIDPKNVDSWIGKGNSAGWLSSLVRDRFDEMISCHDNALNLISDTNSLALAKLDLSIDQFLLAKSYCSMSYEHMVEFISSLGAQHEHVDRICRIIMLCENSKILDPDQDVAEFVGDVALRGLGTRLLSEEVKTYLSDVVKRYPVESGGKLRSTESGKANDAEFDSTHLLVWVVIVLAVVYYFYG